MKTIVNLLSCVCMGMLMCFPVNANAQILGVLGGKSKGEKVVLKSDPEEAAVYLNGQKVCESTPAMIEIPKNAAGTPLIFQFKKDGYQSKSVTVSFTKKELKNNPVVYCTLKEDKDGPARGSSRRSSEAEAKDPTIRQGEAQKVVSRDDPGNTALERAIIRWAFESDPAGARIFWRVVSSCPDQVKNTNETYLTTTPYEETRSFNILGLTYENSRDVTIEIKLRKKGYEDQVKRFNVRQAIDQQEISGFFELVKKDEE